MPSFTALAVLFSDFQKSGLVVLLTENQLFSQNLALLNKRFTVHKLYTWLTHLKQLLGMPDLSLTGYDVPGKEETIKLTYVKKHNLALPFAVLQALNKKKNKIKKIL